MLINTIKELFTKLASFGALKVENESEQGITRLTYSPSFMEAQQFLRDYMISSGMVCSIDAFGNLIGVVEGTNPDLKPILVGSHLDSVPSGGVYDGALGIVVPLAIVKYWKEIGYRPKRSVHVIAFAEEEGTSFGQVCLGSRFFAGELRQKSPYDFLDVENQSMVTKMHLASMSCPKTLAVDYNIQDIYERFVELHIEQGPVLAHEKLPVGIVTGIVGIERFQVSILGLANHAGTTPMEMRQDALVTAANCIEQLYNSALKTKEYMCTCGHIQIMPNSANVVPGEATFTVEFRSINQEFLQNVDTLLASIVDTACLRYHTAANITHMTAIPVVEMDAAGIERLKFIAEKQQISYMELPSGAGHDAMIIGKYIPTNMIFVESKAGISHNPKENSSWEVIEQGAKVMDGYLTMLTSVNCD